MTVSPARISLNGNDWRLRGFLDEDWRRVGAHLPSAATDGWVHASVPGSVQHDLWQAGAIPTPYKERNSLLIEWVAQRSWVYRTLFAAPDRLPGQRAHLRFDGLDYAAEFFLNGVSLGRHSSMFTPAIFDVTHYLQAGHNLLVVAFDPAPHEPSQMGRTSRVLSTKTRMGYGWDFCPRLINLGVWQGVTLDVTGPVRIEDVWVQPRVAVDGQQAAVRVHTTLASTEATEVTVEVGVWRDGAVAANTAIGSLTQDELQGFLIVDLVIDKPALWYPNGYGEQPLYRADVRVITADGASDYQTVTFGLRHIEWVANEGASPDALPYTAIVNGQRIYLKGWNWVPQDALYGVPHSARLARLLTLAQRAHVNLLRVNGVGLIETEDFYRHCDQLGILVWQEFTLTSSAIDRKPSEDAHYIQRVVAEAQGIVPRKRNHPSLAVWTAGNELESLDFLPLDNTEPVIAALRDVVHRLDPDRHWLPTSASGPMPFNGINTTRQHPEKLHDVHGPWHHQGLTDHYTLYNESVNLLHSEFGAEGLTNLKTLVATIGPDQHWPASRTQATWQHLGAGWWLSETLWREVWGAIYDLPTLVRASQYWQAEGVRYAIEAHRRRMFRNSGILPWQFNEPYPMAVGTSAVDYYAHPRPAYYSVARAYAPLSVTARVVTQAWGDHTNFEAEIYVNYTDLTPLSAVRVTARLCGISGRTYSMREWVLDIGGNRVTYVGAFSLPLADLTEDVFLLDLDLTGTTHSINRYLFSRAATLAPLLTLAPTQLAVDWQTIGADDAVLTVHNVGAVAALGVWLDDERAVDAAGYVYYTDNHICLLPGEQRFIGVTWEHVPPAEHDLTIAAWNSPLQRLRR